MENISIYIVDLFIQWGASEKQAILLHSIAFISVIIIFSFLANLLTKKIIVSILEKVIKKSKNEYDDVFIKKRVFENLSHIVPAIIIYFAIPFAFPPNVENASAYLRIVAWIQSMTYIYIIIAVLIVINSFLNTVSDIYDIIAEKKRISLSIKQYLQVAKIVLIIIALILVISVLFDKKPGYSEVDAVEDAWNYLFEEMEYGDFQLPSCVSVSFTGSYERPIPTPVKNLRPARETCEKCHWPEKFYGKRLHNIIHYGRDEASTPLFTSLALKVDAGGHGAVAGGIHWHINHENEVRYTSIDDEREEMIWVEVQQSDGSLRKYHNKIIIIQ